jgi:hypothetical protein
MSVACAAEVCGRFRWEGATSKKTFKLRKAGLIEAIFGLSGQYLRSQGLYALVGQIIDATLVPVPKQRNRREENKKIKAGGCLRAGRKIPIACTRGTWTLDGLRRMGTPTMATK